MPSLTGGLASPERPWKLLRAIASFLSGERMVTSVVLR
ncbi:hypothetical protein RISK_003331 [Rhodopirellula islandica]|uniref:Uncharacterized protein n=1 Tax=Rhodopirellula islandica TaxID=595434 RepID=A0A0J1EGP1_RHOIS|nr:hypothetical protein RISK_003331 [Rhodopirellula islandica]